MARILKTGTNGHIGSNTVQKNLLPENNRIGRILRLENRASRMLATRVLLVLLTTLMLVISPLWNPASIVKADGPISGVNETCQSFGVGIAGFFGLWDDIYLADISEPGWAWVYPSQPIHSVTGIASNSEVSHTDNQALHLSHDQTTYIQLDPGQEGMTSIVNPPNEIEMEWEIGTYPSERGRNEPERFLAKWAWPNVSDRVWTNGHWVYDCFHGQRVDSTYRLRTEIHPARALATMRDQVRTLPGSGSTPVPVTATDLIIHGRGGFAANSLYWGPDFVYTIAYGNEMVTTPIDDYYEFDIYLPPRPAPQAVLVTTFENGPGNTVDLDPQFTVVDRPDDEILEGERWDASTVVHVKVDLRNSGVQPEDVYARRIYSGWVFPHEGLQRFQVTLNRMVLQEDHEWDPGDCECTFFWMNVDRALGNEWIRLVDFANGNMNAYDDDDWPGDGYMDFTGAEFDFYVRNGQPFSVRANGYEQDCWDDLFGVYGFIPLLGWVADCYFASAFELNYGNNDEFAPLFAEYGPENNYGLEEGQSISYQNVTAGGEYRLEFTIEDIPVVEDPADLRISKDCQPDKLLSGEAFTCEISVENAGPGLPRNVQVADTISTTIPSGQFAISIPTWPFDDGITVQNMPCIFVSSLEIQCNLGTVPVGRRYVISYTVIPQKGGNFTDTAVVTTDTTDPDPSTNTTLHLVTVVQVVPIDIKPGGFPNGVNVNPNNHGIIPVAILSTPDFDAPARVDSSSLTFGPTGDEDSFVHSSDKKEDVNGDGLLDLVVRFNNQPPLFQCGDTLGILRGKTLDGMLIEGIDSIKPSPCP